MTKPVWGEEHRTTTVCVDSYQSSVLTGRLYNSSMENGVVFQSVTQLLLEMETLLDRMEFPKAFTAPRTFCKAPGGREAPCESQVRQGDLATFRLRILFRQNASWQGSVTWVEGRQEQSFRSVLELLMLIHSALELQKAS